MDSSYVTTKLRCYSGIIGLYYEEQGVKKLWSIDDVKRIVRGWIQEQGQVNLSVIVSNPESLFYSSGSYITEEPCVKVYGEIVRPNTDVVDEKIKKALVSLFSCLKSELKQYSVRFHFRGYSEDVSVRIC